MTTARELMSSPVETLDDTLTLRQAAEKLAGSNVGSMPVIGSDGKPCGMLTDRDLVVKGLAKGLDVDSATVEECCSHELVTVSVDDDAAAVAKALASHQLRRVPVVDGDQIVGIISQADVARELPNQQTGDVVEAISK